MVYLARRVAWALLLLWVVTLVTFTLSHVIPGDPATFLAGFGATKEKLEALREQMGLAKPLPVQYALYIGGLLHLDFGTSLRTGNAVSADLAHYLPASLELAGVSFTLYAVIAVLLGTLAAARRGGVLDVLSRAVSITGSGVPVFWLGLLLQEAFFAQLRWLPYGGRIDITAHPPPQVTGFYTVDSLIAGNFPLFASVSLHMVLPVITIVLAMLAVGFRATRSSVVDELDSPYVRTARAKGMPEWHLYSVHILRNAINPVISILGLQAGYLLGWIVLVETVFNWPGFGFYAYQSISNLDYPPIMALTLILSAGFIFLNLMTDLLYPLFDPRLRAA
jgi:peptide/nickel transport system permease protein